MLKANIFLSLPAALLMLAGCATDGNKPVQPPMVTAQPEAPSEATIAWAKLIVADALAAEKAGREKGLAEGEVKEAVMQMIIVQTNKLEGTMAHSQRLIGLKLAIADPANTVLTRQAFVQAVAILETGSYGSCRICK